MSVLVARISQSPWPGMADSKCNGTTPVHPAEWVVWTEQVTGDSMRFTCGKHLGEWVTAVWDRIDGKNEL
jgi:hypothetical protein